MKINIKTKNMNVLFGTAISKYGFRENSKYVLLRKIKLSTSLMDKYLRCKKFKNKIIIENNYKMVQRDLKSKLIQNKSNIFYGAVIIARIIKLENGLHIGKEKK